MTGADPYVISPDSLGVPASNGHVYIRMQNNTSCAYGELFFVTNGDTSYSAGKALVFPINANSGYTVYDVDMSGVSGWSGTIKQLRLDIVGNSGTVDVDYVKMGGSGGGGSVPSAPTGLSAAAGNAQVTLSWAASAGATSYTIKRGTTSGTYGTTVATGVTSTSYTNTGLTNGTTYYYVITAVNSYGESGNSGGASASPTSGSSYAAEWNFNVTSDSEGWTNGTDASTTVSSGSLHITSTGTDPGVYSANNLGIAASGNGHVYVRMKNASSAAGCQLYFITNSDTSWGENKVLNLGVTANSDYTVYDFNMTGVANWNGTIKQFRFDPGNATGTYDVDYIRVGP
ncbi:hypothetical protein GT003_27655 [Paenibacillus sacheonensis]|uniref:Fibronectin type-III domain-containing protein n=2 Tax=Paenibacillus sacheonensis TaxID=742054 RepID=A0A7X4YUH7_9BACL|nr:hypothetical protein [Paenibacillus sacheonensis]